MTTLRTILAMLFVGAAAMLAAGAGDGYDLSWHTIDGGGGTSTGGGFQLSGTIGQPDAGAMSGGSYLLVGGFWAGAGDAPDPGPTCPADLDNNGFVGVSDLLALLACWGPLPGPAGCDKADLTNSGSVGVADLLSLLSQWGPCP